MFTLEGGNPIAKIINSDTFSTKKGKFKYLGLIDQDNISEDDKPGYKLDPYSLVSEDEIIAEIGSVNQKLINKKMKEKIKCGKLPEIGKVFILNDGMLSPIPDITKERECLYVSGKSGSGKSTWISNYLENYCQLYPDNSIYMFSALDNDPAFDKFEETGPKKTRGKLTRILLDKDYLDEIGSGDEITVNDLENSAVIFDDVDMLSNKKMRENVVALRKECLEIGRHFSITVCCTTHHLCASNITKELLNESDKVVVFPRCGSKHGITYFLKNYEGMDSKEVKKLLDLPSRWVMICRGYNGYVMYKDGAYLT